MSRMRIDEVEIRDADIFEILLDNFPDMIHSIDETGRIIYTNRTAERLLGYGKDELMGMNVRQIYADEILEAVEKGFSDLKQRGDKTVESLLKAKDGTRIAVEIRSFSIYDDHGNFLRTFSILRDIRHVKELQQSLVHAGRLAAIGELASGVAHDINNPLTVILLSIDMVLSGLSKVDLEAHPPLQRIRQHAQDVQKASKAIQKLADHLRTFARGMQETYEPVDLFTTINDSIFMVHSKITNHAIMMENHVKQGHYYVLASPNQLEQVFMNLVSNACDAMAGREERHLTISVEPANRDGIDYWRVDVTDTGGGIPDEIKDEIFRSFFTTKEKGKGTGLGLSISRGIVRDHKGEIDLASQVGVGTTFSVFLPQLIETEAQAQ